MDKPITLCSRCDNAARCLLNYDGVPCRKTRTVEPTNADCLRSMSDEELAAWIAEHPVVAIYDESNPLHKKWLDWLREEAKNDRGRNRKGD